MMASNSLNVGRGWNSGRRRALSLIWGVVGALKLLLLVLARTKRLTWSTNADLLEAARGVLVWKMKQCEFSSTPIDLDGPC